VYLSSNSVDPSVILLAFFFEKSADLGACTVGGPNNNTPMGLSCRIAVLVVRGARMPVPQKISWGSSEDFFTGTNDQ
jgi:hypothetical protein